MDEPYTPYVVGALGLLWGLCARFMLWACDKRVPSASPKRELFAIGSPIAMLALTIFIVLQIAEVDEWLELRLFPVACGVLLAYLLTQACRPQLRMKIGLLDVG